MERRGNDAGRLVRHGLGAWREGRIFSCRVEFKREVELVIVLRVGRDIGGGTRLFLFLVAALDVSLQRGFAPGLDLALELFGKILNQLDLGRMPFAWIERPEGV